ncbi:MAG: purine-nucleoside phosphorylase [Candidatus Electryonea clarkiae]|nr:purine-nucleoside phosphorylase [Candidatus Electryonea clarkiae]MDP8285713.1 purine-nucleoside phosphorylase [Candidatus Electryonea clarkiae]
MRKTNDPEIKSALEYVTDRVETEPEIALILGSGLGSFAEEVNDPVIIPTELIPGYPISTVTGHAGRLIAGEIDGVSVIIIQGRVHYYEGYPISKVVVPVRLAAALGAKTLVVTNAAGGIGDHLEPGDLMAITDHINLMGINPLIGQNWGFDRFPDMTNAYDPNLIAALHRAAKKQDIKLKEGILGVSSGPTYETASEIKMMKMTGVSATCMSTAPEVITAARLKLPACGISCITNMATGISKAPLTHEEVTEIAGQVESKFRRLLRAAVTEISSTS